MFYINKNVTFRELPPPLYHSFPGIFSPFYRFLQCSKCGCAATVTMLNKNSAIFLHQRTPPASTPLHPARPADSYTFFHKTVKSVSDPRSTFLATTENRYYNLSRKCYCIFVQSSEQSQSYISENRKKDLLTSLRRTRGN